MSDWDNLTNRLSEGFGIIGGAVKDYLTAKTDEFNGVKTELIGKIDGLDGKIAAMPNDFDVKINAVHKNIDEKYGKLDGKIASVEGRITARIDGLGGRFDALEGRIGGIESTLAGIRELLGKFLGLEQEIAAKQTEIDNLKNDLNAAKSELAAANNQIGNLRGDLERTNGEVAALRNELNTAETARADAQAQVRTLTDDLASTKKNFDELSAELRTAVEEREAAENNLSGWRKAARIYEPVRAAMRGCDTFGKLAERRGLDLGDSEIGIFAFVQEIDTGVEFLKDVHKTAVEFKNEQGAGVEPMTEAEREVYLALNACYRQLWDIDFDVFTAPGSRQPLSEPFQKADFNSKEATALKDPRNKGFRFTKNIYVPLLLNGADSILLPAYVDAGNT